VNLREFIASALTQIHHGAKDAAEKVPGLCPPTVRSDRRPDSFHLRQSPGGKPVSFQYVDFDIAVTASKVEGGKATLGVVAFGAGIDTTTTNQQISRIKFKLPMVLPADLDGE
jgi:hypothetical protein